MSLVWVTVQLVFWVACMVLVVAAAVAAVLAPPYVVYRLIRH